MNAPTPEAYCLLCDRPAADAHFQRVCVWEDDLWRVTTSLRAPVPGFSYLEPKRHIPDITTLDGPEAASLGTTLARVTRTLRQVTRSKLVYVNVFGERVAHLHFNLAPHRDGDALRGGPGMLEAGAQPLPSDELRDVAQAIRASLAAAGEGG